MSSPPAVLEMNAATVMRGPTVTALNQVSLTVAPGQHTAVIGPNGSGKSTLLGVVTRDFYPVARPDGPPPVRLFGQDRWNVFELRRRLGVLGGDLDLIFATARVSALAAALSAWFASLGLGDAHQVTDAMVDRARTALERVGVGHLSATHTCAVSTGERRRILIARALVHQPEALLMDEPTTGLDLLARRQLLGLLAELAAEGRTLVLVTHHLEEVLPAVEQVVILSRGQVTASGAKDDVLTSANLTAAYGAAIEVTRQGEWFSARLRDD